MNNTKYKVGDRVFYLRYGWGTVISTTHKFGFSIQVKFNGNRETNEYFTAEGHLHDDALYPSLLTMQQANLLGYYDSNEDDDNDYDNAVRYAMSGKAFRHIETLPIPIKAHCTCSIRDLMMRGCNGECGANER